MKNYNIGTREEWLEARLKLLREEKAFTRRSDELAQGEISLDEIERITI